MPGRDTARLARELREAGVAADVPCAAVSQAATPHQTHAVSRLDEFPDLECGPAPLLVLVGRAMEALLHSASEYRVSALIAEAAECGPVQDQFSLGLETLSMT
jgi:uroporphyrin-III C-methyltransferase